MHTSVATEQQTEALNTLNMLLQQTISQLQGYLSSPIPASQELPAATHALAIQSQPSTKVHTEPTPAFTPNADNPCFFDPSGFVERKFFAGAPNSICSYLNKYFVDSLDHQAFIQEKISVRLELV